MKLTVAQGLDRHTSHQMPYGKVLPFIIDACQGEDKCATPKALETGFDRVVVT
jgi:hypothetical protein